MTTTAATALPALTEVVLGLGAQLVARDWSRPSACPGWTVHDVVVHLTCTLREVVAPDALPEPVVGSIERTNDVAVAAFRDRSPRQTLEDYRELVEPAVANLRRMQAEPTASEIVDFQDAGRYPTHLVADSLVFDHHCHLRHDLGGRGPLKLEIEADEGVTSSTLEWLMAGLPQMSPPRLTAALDAPVELELTGAGGGTWTLQRVDDQVDVLPGARNGAARLSSTADEFLLWGTHRINWEDSTMRLQGDRDLATRVASAIHVF
jgi:uncharacterized protein (TIGR03083 family)